MLHILSRARALVAHALPCLLLLAAARPARAQTDFMNLDRGRPFQVEDAITAERWALELQVSPLRLERASGGGYHWGFEPGVNIGIFPRVELEIGLPIAMTDLNGKRTTALAGIDLGVLHQLNTESTTLPAFGLRLDALLPVGGFAPTQAYTTVGLLATRSFDDGVRLHANASFTSGGARTGVQELSRWMTGLALDRTLPLRFALVGVEATLREPMDRPGMQEWSAGVGTRVQLDPRWLLDLGAGRRGGAGEESWYASVGGAYAFGWRFGLVPGGR
jgi:hypothetical protein